VAYQIPKKRILILFVVGVSCFLLLLSRLAYLQFFHPRNLEETAKRQSQLIKELPPFRGKILDRNHEELALDVRLYSLGANARRIPFPEVVADQLAPILDLDKAYLMERLSRDKSFVWVARKLSKEKTEAVKALNIRELEFRPEWKRIYPNKTVASQVVGFTGLDHYGLEGAEYWFDSFLKGIPGWKSTLKDAKQRELVARQQDYVMPVDGYDVVLSMDVVIQHWADKYLTETCDKYNAMAGSLIVMDAETGDVLALANYPSFDPNQVAHSDANARRNRSITDMYEPGSVFKIFTLSTALENSVVKPDDEVFCEYGSYRTGGRVLHDAHPYGRLTVADVISKSSNIGTAKIAKKIGPDRLYQMMKRFGFGEKTHIDLPGEISGLITHPQHWSAPSLSSVAMGQEVGVTAIQLASAVNAIINDGLLVKPRMVLEVRGENGQMIKAYPPVVQRRVISKETAQAVQEIMMKVVEEGTGRRARIRGVNIGGKTGTAQKLEPDGAYSHDHFIASFAGFVENNDQKITIVVSIDDPSPQYYGGTVAAPLFRKIAEKIIEYWQ